MRGRFQSFMLPAIPATTTTAAVIAIKATFHQTAIAYGMAGLVGLLALLGVIAASDEAQKTLRLWIQHRAEREVAAAASFAIREQIRALTCGRRWTSSGAKAVREAAAKYSQPTVSLAEVMTITRCAKAAQVDPLNNGHTFVPCDGNGVLKGPLEIVQPRDGDRTEQPTGDSRRIHG